MSKPKVRLTGVDGNVFNIIAAVSKALEKANLDAEQFQTEAFNAESYDKVLQLAMQYCEVS